jgi:RNA polymerase sigma factor (TIGR02999 family)
MSEVGEITRLLRELGGGSTTSPGPVLDRLMSLVYRELKLLARSNRRRQGGRFDPGTTSLVHEAYARLAQVDEIAATNRRQFFCVASKAMRSILIDNARWHQRLKRGSGEAPLPLDEQHLVSAERSDELLAVDEALTRLGVERPGLESIVECRCFGGLTVEETAEALDISTATVKRRWSLARSWLYRELGPAAP